LVTSYFDRQYGNDETTGFSDISLSTSKSVDLFRTTRVTTGSMPPPTQFSGTFYGDYTGLAVTDRAAFPIWMDTRDPDLFVCPGTAVPGKPPTVCTGTVAGGTFQADLTANDQDIFTAGVPLSNNE
jgi:hypothetical protein